LGFNGAKSIKLSQKVIDSLTKKAKEYRVYKKINLVLDDFKMWDSMDCMQELPVNSQNYIEDLLEIAKRKRME
jgi:hypothetical protein